jgi:RecB family exonuclease
MADVDTPLNFDDMAQGILHSYHTQSDALGPSKIVAYLQCPRAYCYQYVDKIPAPSSPAAALGSTFHAIVQKAHAERWTVNDSDAAADALTELWDLVCPETSDPDDPDAAKAFLEARDKWMPWYLHWIEGQVDIAVEERFEIDLCEYTGIDGSILQGTVDRVYRCDGLTVISDVKTGKRTPSAADMANNLQLSLYSWAYRQLAGEEEDAIEICQVRTGQTPRTRRTTDYLDDVLFNVVVPVVFQIATGQFPCNPNTKYGCGYCDYQELCTVGRGVI